MSQSFKSYRKYCFKAIRELLAHKGNSTVNLWLLRAMGTKTENELSRLMVEIRTEI